MIFTPYAFHWFARIPTILTVISIYLFYEFLLYILIENAFNAKEVAVT